MWQCVYLSFPLLYPTKMSIWCPTKRTTALTTEIKGMLLERSRRISNTVRYEIGFHVYKVMHKNEYKFTD